MGGGSLTSNAEEVRSSVEYRQYEEMGCEIRDALLQVRQQAGAEGSGRGSSTQGGGDLSVLRGRPPHRMPAAAASFAAAQSTDKNILEQ